MKLYIYDHCPYCVKARMIFGLKKIPVQLVTLLNDDEETPISMIGVKMVPVLEAVSEKKGRIFMPESLDIIRYADKESPLVSSWEEDPDLSEWLDESGSLAYELAMPRWVRSGMEEFKTKSAQKYFTAKKEAMIGPFPEALAKTDGLIKEIKRSLQKLEAWLPPKEKGPFFKGERLTADDFHLFAFLRALSIVKPLGFPPKTARYMKRLSGLSAVPLNHDIAL